LKYVEDLAIGSNQSTIVNYGARSAAEYAAFANATFGHGFELDDFAPRATAHPGCVAVPSALSVGERQHLSGKDLLTGVALASEVITGVGEAGMKWMLARGFHETCILGVFGASAVAAQRLTRLQVGGSLTGCSVRQTYDQRKQLQFAAAAACPRLVTETII
jgi:2-methylcitrate dehydratase PrpD